MKVLLKNADTYEMKEYDLDCYTIDNSIKKIKNEIENGDFNGKLWFIYDIKLNKFYCAPCSKKTLSTEERFKNQARIKKSADYEGTIYKEFIEMKEQGIVNCKNEHDIDKLDSLMVKKLNELGKVLIEQRDAFLFIKKI